jgi:hypothetical protein
MVVSLTAAMFMPHIFSMSGHDAVGKDGVRNFHGRTSWKSPRSCSTHGERRERGCVGVAGVSDGLCQNSNELWVP